MDSSVKKWMLWVTPWSSLSKVRAVGVCGGRSISFVSKERSFATTVGPGAAPPAVAVMVPFMVAGCTSQWKKYEPSGSGATLYVVFEGPVVSALEQRLLVGALLRILAEDDDVVLDPGLLVVELEVDRCLGGDGEARLLEPLGGRLRSGREGHDRRRHLLLLRADDQERERAGDQRDARDDADVSSRSRRGRRGAGRHDGGRHHDGDGDDAGRDGGRGVRDAEQDPREPVQHGADHGERAERDQDGQQQTLAVRALAHRLISARISRSTSV